MEDFGVFSDEVGGNLLYTTVAKCPQCGKYHFAGTKEFVSCVDDEALEDRRRKYDRRYEEEKEKLKLIRLDELLSAEELKQMLEEAKLSVENLEAAKPH